MWYVRIWYCLLSICFHRFAHLRDEHAFLIHSLFLHSKLSMAMKTTKNTEKQREREKEKIQRNFRRIKNEVTVRISVWSGVLTNQNWKYAWTDHLKTNDELTSTCDNCMKWLRCSLLLRCNYQFKLQYWTHYADFSAQLVCLDSFHLAT